jgi:hypothetical protein
MAEGHAYAGTAFGALGALDVVLRRCMEGFAFWQRINDSSESARNFQALLHWQRIKLAVWAQAWGIESGNHRKDRWFCMYEADVMNRLQLIHRVFSNFSNPNSPAPLLNQTHTLAMDVLPRVNPLSASSPGPNSLGNLFLPNEPEPEFTMPVGVKWALQEDKLKDGLSYLTRLIDDLHSVFPPPRLDPARALVLSDLLTTQDPNELARISRVENIDPTHAALAWMASVAHRPYGAHLGINQLHASHLVPIERKEGEAKYMARYKGELVFVEEKSCAAPWGQQEQLNVLKARIDNIVVRLQNADKPMELRTLPCRGGVFSKARSTAEDLTAWTYNIVYLADKPLFVSLRDILGRENGGLNRARLPLGKRFAVGQMLARALMHLHLANWLHKAVRSENVVFFVEEKESVHLDLPYLIGFEHSRLDAPGEQTENVEEKPDHKFYRHPKAMTVPVADIKQPLGGPGRHSKVYDIYSLGVVLLEIGLFATAEKIVGKHLEPKDQTPEGIRKVMVERAIPALRFHMGDLYADATLACLDGSLDKFTRESIRLPFYNDVVCRLELCRA